MEGRSRSAPADGAPARKQQQQVVRAIPAAEPLADNARRFAASSPMSCGDLRGLNLRSVKAIHGGDHVEYARLAERQVRRRDPDRVRPGGRWAAPDPGGGGP